MAFRQLCMHTVSLIKGEVGLPNRRYPEASAQFVFHACNPKKPWPIHLACRLQRLGYNVMTLYDHRNLASTGAQARPRTHPSP